MTAQRSDPTASPPRASVVLRTEAEGPSTSPAPLPPYFRVGFVPGVTLRPTRFQQANRKERVKEGRPRLLTHRTPSHPVSQSASCFGHRSPPPQDGCQPNIEGVSRLLVEAAPPRGPPPTEPRATRRNPGVNKLQPVEFTAFPCQILTCTLFRKFDLLVFFPLLGFLHLSFNI